MMVDSVFHGVSALGTGIAIYGMCGLAVLKMTDESDQKLRELAYSLLWLVPLGAIMVLVSSVVISTN